MTSQNFDECLKRVLVHEGGYVDHPADPGGATNKGITIATYRKWVNRDGTKEDLKRITDSQVASIYRKQYWNAVRGDDLPSGVDYAVFDFAVNSGPTRAIKYLQTILGVNADGKIGPVTLAAAQTAHAGSVINGLCDRRMAFLKQLKTFDTFGKGWTARVSGVRSVALKMAEAKPLHPIPTHLGPEPQDTFDGGSNEGIIVEEYEAPLSPAATAKPPIGIALMAGLVALGAVMYFIAKSQGIVP